MKPYQVIVATRGSSLSPTQRLVLVHVALRAGEDGVCWASVPTLCRDTGYGATAVRRALAGLVADRVLAADSKSGRPTSYRVCWAPSDTPTEGEGVGDTPPPGEGVSVDPTTSRGGTPPRGEGVASEPHHEVRGYPTTSRGGENPTPPPGDGVPHHLVIPPHHEVRGTPPLGGADQYIKIPEQFLGSDPPPPPHGGVEPQGGEGAGFGPGGLDPVEVVREAVRKAAPPAASEPPEGLTDLELSLWRAGREDEAAEAAQRAAVLWERAAAGDAGLAARVLRQACGQLALCGVRRTAVVSGLLIEAARREASGEVVRLRLVGEVDGD